MSKAENKDFIKFILVVDDEEVNREILGMILGGSYEIMYASDGDEALDMMRAFSDILSLVLLDLMMPKKNGYEVLSDIQADPALQKIPVVVLTSEKEAEIKSLKMGAADFLTKPYDLPEVILARVAHSIALYENTNLIQSTETDQLTGLYNREFFFRYCERFKSHNPDVSTDAIVLNVNRFHMINALYGRHFGDKVLCAVSNRIGHELMTRGGMACRYDADTFYMYVPHFEDYDAFEESIASGISAVLRDGDTRLRIGINPNIDRDVAIEENFSWALQVCNSLRKSNGVSYAVYDAGMKSDRIRKAKLMDDFDRAISEKQFKVYYQPKFDITGDSPTLCSAEALVRWVHPVYGMISPGEFIPLFEENGLIQRLDRYVWEEAGRQILEWYDRYGVYLSVSVNVSRIDIYSLDVTDFLADLLSKYRIPPKYYKLEITESAYTDDSGRIVDMLTSLRGLGFEIEMDDFGTGYSSLNMLNVLPIDILKIDKAFLKNITVDPKAKKMLGLVIDIAEFMEMPVVAEGVETAEEYKILKELNCDIIQGYYFSKPLPAEDMSAMIEERADDLR